ncbi:unnamed protein product, partial [Effrenium voratum]
DSLNHVVRSLDLDTGLMETIAGTGEPGFSETSAVLSQLNMPMGLALDEAHQLLYLADARNHRVRAVALSPGEYYQAEENRTSSGATADSVRLHGPLQRLVCEPGSELLLGSKHCAGSTGNGYAEFRSSYEDRMDFRVEATQGAGTYQLRLRYADRYSEVRSAGHRQLRLLVNGAVVTSQLGFKPSGRLSSGSRDEYSWSVADVSLTTGTNLIQLQVTGHWGPKIDLLYVLPPLPAITTVAGTGTGALPAVEDVSTDQTATASNLRTPTGLALDASAQLLYIADTENGRVRRLDLGAGTIRTIAGGATTDEVSDGLDAASSKLFRPSGLALDTARGFLYVSDFHQNRLRRVDLGSNALTGGTVTTVTGTALGAGFEHRLLKPSGLLLDTTSDLLYVADSGHARLRIVDPTTTTCGAELPTFATKQFCGQQSMSEADCLLLGCCYDASCASLPNFDGRQTPGFQPEDVLTRVDGAKLEPPISFVYGGTERCCHPNLRPMATLDVAEWPNGLALDAANRLLYVAEGKDHRVVRIHLDEGRCVSADASSQVC